MSTFITEDGPETYYDDLGGIQAFSETDLAEDVRRMDVPTLILQGDDDQIVPIAAYAASSSQIVTDSTQVVYSGGDHGISTTTKNRVNQDLWALVTGNGHARTPS